MTGTIRLCRRKAENVRLSHRAVYPCTYIRTYMVIYCNIRETARVLISSHTRTVKLQSAPPKEDRQNLIKYQNVRT